MVKKALVAGLNYPNQNHQLYGCVNDCLNWVSVLEKQFHFEEVRVLIDQNPDGSLTTYPTQIPTKHNILAQLGWLCSGVRQGDVLVFVFAGHGTQIRTGSQYADEALVPEDFSHTDEQGNPTLVFDDELHALFKRLPSGSFLTAILDCSHATHMLDVPSFIEGGKAQHSRSKPLEVNTRLEHAWRKNPHAYARPRFIQPVSWKGPRHKRTEEGSGQHVGRMNLDPGVTAFCFAACSTHEVALDANIKAQQQGTMSFCLQEALVALHNTCTYERLLEKATEIADDVRSKYMPTMDQNFHLSFCPHGPPSEVVFLDDRYATVAQHRYGLKREKESQERPQPQSPQPASPSVERREQQHQQQLQQQQRQQQRQQPVPREPSSDFIPTPMYSGQPQGEAMARQEPASPMNHQRQPELPATPDNRAPQVQQDARSPMPNAGVGAPAFDLLGMGPLSLGLSSPSAVTGSYALPGPATGSYALPGPATGSYAAPQMGMPPIAEVTSNGSPMPDRNLFGMPNLFSGFSSQQGALSSQQGGFSSQQGAAVGASSAGASAANAGGASTGSSNLFSNLFGGASNFFGGAANQQQPPSPQGTPFSSQQQAYSSQQPTSSMYQPVAGGLLGSQLPATGAFSSSQQAFGSTQPAAFSSQQQGAFSSQQPGAFSSQQQQAAFSSQQPAAFGSPWGPTRSPSGFGSTLGATVGLGSPQISGRSSVTPHVNAYTSSVPQTNMFQQAFASGAGAGAITTGSTAFGAYPQVQRF